MSQGERATFDRANRGRSRGVPAWKDLGGLSVREVLTSRFRLDGGSMYGQVPKALWNRWSKADRGNRIPLVVRSLLVRTGGALLLVDPGMGSRYGPEEVERMAIDPEFASLSGTLRRSGIDPEAVTDVILTHLHFDHIGGLAGAGPDGSPALELPRAKIWLHRAQWERAHAPGPKERRSFREEDLEVLSRADLRYLEGPGELAPGVSVRPTEGHTRGLLVVRVQGRTEEVLYPTDLLPTLAHMRLAYTTGFDLWPERLLEEKAAILEEASRNSSWIIFAHDPATAAARVAPGAEGYVVRERVATLWPPPGRGGGPGRGARA